MMTGKFLFVILGLTVMALFAPFAADADSPVPQLVHPREGIVITVNNAPDNIKYFDLLVPKDLQGIRYGVISKTVLNNHPELKHSQLSAYDEGGFVSYSMYYRDGDFPAVSHAGLGPGCYIINFYKLYYYSISGYRIAAVDGKGDLMRISPPIIVKPQKSGYNDGVSYDYEKNTVAMDTHAGTGPSAALFYLLLRFGFTIAAETLIAVPFKIRPLRAVALLNLVSEIILTTGMLILDAYKVPYILSLIIFEFLVLLIEFFGLMEFGKNPRLLKTAVFVLAANAVSLCLGLWFNSVGAFKV